MKLLAANNAQTTLANSISNVATTANLQSGAGILFPDPTVGEEYYVQTFTDAATGLLTEIVWVTQRIGDTVTMLRGQEGTTPRGWTANDLVGNLMTAGQLATMVQAAEAQAQAGNYAEDEGIVDAYSVTLDPVVNIPQPGMPLRVLIANTNTGPCTIDYGAGPVAIKRFDGSDTIGGELLASCVIDMIIRESFVQLTAITPATAAAISAGTDTASAVTPAQLANFSALFSGAITFAATLSPPTGWLLSYGQALNRVGTYANLFAAITRSSNVTISNASPAVVSWNSHGLKIGDRISFETTGTLPSGITVGTDYFVISTGFGANSFQFSTSRGGSAVNTGSTGSGVQSCRFNPYGCGNGTSTFNVPATNGNALVAIDDLGGSAAGNLTGGVNLGAVVGDESNTVTSGVNGGNINTANNAGQSTAPGSHTHSVTVSTVQSTILMNCFIKI